MIIYKNNVENFIKETRLNEIADNIEEKFLTVYGRHVSPSEKKSWTNSMQFMANVLDDERLMKDAGVLIEYKLPTTSARIDFIIAGKDEKMEDNFIIIELKQWSDVYATQKADVVQTFLGGKEVETVHPSYQATSYKLYLKDFNENIACGEVNPYSCAYLHNYKEHFPVEPLKAPIYQESLKESPIFLKNDVEKLQDFIVKYVGNGKGNSILYKIENGNIKPSKKLIDYVASLFEGNQEFVLIDEQKVVYESILDVVNNNINKNKKFVIVVEGGPGTGKSVLSVNLLAGFLKKNLNTVFVAPNAAFREVMIEKLSKGFQKKRLKNLFKGSSAFLDAQKNIFDVIIVDEAHRLKDSKAFMYSGENQAQDIIYASKVSIFFLDNNQVIRPEDIGSTAEIFRIAEEFHAEFERLELNAQFRCAGADGFLNWIDDVLQIRETANFDGWDTEAFEFKIFEDPHDLVAAINKKQEEGKSARILAGYAWKWTTAKNGNVDANVEDISIPEYNFKMPWNSRMTGPTWAIDENCSNQIGCVHTAQGLEFDYVGVIVGKDLRFDSKKLEYYADWNNYFDVKGKAGLKDEPEKLTALIKNIYRILMSRGMKGCYVFFQDKEMEAYFKQRLAMVNRER